MHRGDDQVVKLQKENARLAKLLAASKRKLDSEKVLGEDAQNDDLEGNDFEYTVGQLQERKKMLLGFGKTANHPDVAKLCDQISLQQEAKNAVLPGHVRIAKADKKIKVAKLQHDLLVAKQEKMGSELALMQTRISEHAADVVAAYEDIEQAERQREEILVELQPKQEKL